MSAASCAPNTVRRCGLSKGCRLMPRYINARQHPLALVAAAGAVYAIGPKRLLGWVSTALPILVRLRALR